MFGWIALHLAVTHAGATPLEIRNGDLRVETVIDPYWGRGEAIVIEASTGDLCRRTTITESLLMLRRF